MRLSKMFIVLVLLAFGIMLNASESELIEKRGLFSKTFQLNNGLEKLVLHSEPIHYLDFSNSFIEIPQGVDETDSLINLARAQSSGGTRDQDDVSVQYNHVLSTYLDTTHTHYTNPDTVIITSERMYTNTLNGNYVVEESLNDTTSGNADLRIYTAFQIYVPDFEPWFEIQSVTHKMDIAWYTEIGVNDDGYYTFTFNDFIMPVPIPPENDPPSNYEIYESIGNGTTYDQFTIDRTDNSNHVGVLPTTLETHASTLQNSIEQSPQPLHMNVYFAYLINGENYHLEEEFILQFATAPTLEIVYKTTVEGRLANRYLPFPTAGNMGGTLSIIDHDNSAHTHEHVESLAPVELNPGDTCTALTDSIDFNAGEFHHHSWESALASSFLMQLSTFPIDNEENEISAYFNDQFQLNLPTGIPEILLKDPWYVSNPAANPEDWIQPNIFRTVAEMQSDNSNRVFEDENEQFNSTFPIYYLNAPYLTSMGSGVYKIFDHWGGGHVLYGVGQSTTDDYETPVVFTAANANPTPSFYHLSVEGSASVWMASEIIYLQAPSFKVDDEVFKSLNYSITGAATLITQAAQAGYKKYRLNISGAATITFSYSAIGPGDIADVTSALDIIPSGTNIYMPATSQINLTDPTRFGINLTGASLEQSYIAIRSASDPPGLVLVPYRTPASQTTHSG